MSEQETPNSNYGDLKGHTLQTQDLESGDVPQSDNLESENIHISPIPSPQHSIATATPTNPLPSSSESDTFKLDLMSFCSKKRIIPDFRKQSAIKGFYKVLLMVDVPIIGYGEIKHFEELVTASTKKEAENGTSRVILGKLHEFYATYSPPDVSRAKQQLAEFIQKDHQRFLKAEFEPDSIEGPCTFRQKVTVVDKVTQQSYTIIGQGVGKKDAEKDGAYRMLRVLEGVSSIPPQQTNKVETLETKFASQFPDFQLQYLPWKPEDGCDTILHHTRLIVSKEQRPVLTVAICTGVDEEAANQSCAAVFFTHQNDFKKKLTDY